jgi:predicted RNA-binding Zn ribbon-like protein
LFLRTIPIGSDLDLIIFEIVFSFAELITKYDIKRVKFCKNLECRWIFYDESRNHTRRWCDNTCATLMKVRRFRENRKYGKGKNSNET